MNSYKKIKQEFQVININLAKINVKRMAKTQQIILL